MFCDLVFGLIGLLILIIVSYLKRSKWNDLKNSFNEKQLKTFGIIYQQRLWLLIYSLLIAIIICFFISYIVSPRFLYSKICFNITILTLLTTSIFYLFPKIDYLEYHLNKDQLRKWYLILDNIKFISIIGFLTGLIFYFFITKTIKYI